MRFIGFILNNCDGLHSVTLQYQLCQHCKSGGGGGGGGGGSGSGSGSGSSSSSSSSSISSSVLSRRRNAATDSWSSQSDAGSEFHVAGPAMAKLRGP